MAESPRRPDQVQLGPQNLKGLSHPLRVRLLGLLREDGPSTATKLAQRVGQSSGATSYHLRQLETYGFIVEDPGHSGPGRERWWKAVHWGSHLGAEQIRANPDESEGFLRAMAFEQYQRVDRFMAEFTTQPPEWDEATTLSDTMYRLTLDEACELRADILALMDRYREDKPDIPAPEGAERVVFQVYAFPQFHTDEPNDDEPEEK